MRFIKHWIGFTILAILAIWLVGYLGTSFIAWEVLNPVRWVMDLPNADASLRGGYLGVAGVLMLVTAGGTIGFFEHTEKSEVTPSAPTPAPYHREHLVDGRIVQQPQLDAVDIAMGVAGGMVAADIIGDIFD